MEELIKSYWEDIICGVLSTTENKFNKNYFTSKDKKNIPEGMCALKTEYQVYKSFKTSKPCGNYKFIEEENFELSEYWNFEYKKQAEVLFGLLNIFCEKDNIEWLSNEYDIALTEAVSYIFSLLSDKLCRVKFKDLFSKVDKFTNGIVLKNNLTQMNLSLSKIDFSRSTSVILTKKTEKEKKINSILSKLDGKNKSILKSKLKNKMKHWSQISKQEKGK